MLVDGAVRTELPNATTADYSESRAAICAFRRTTTCRPGPSSATGAPRWLGCQVICGDGGGCQFFWPAGAR